MRKIRKRWWIVFIFSFLFLILDIILFMGIKQNYPKISKKQEKTTIITTNETTPQTAIKANLKDITLSSGYALLIDMNSQEILYEKNSREKIYPASLTKVLTAITALDGIADLSQTADVTFQDIEGLWEENASVAGFKAGDMVSYEQALYGLILPSGADAANFLANHLAGSVPAFVKDMNKKAKALGMNNTHFMNTSGLHQDDHYTTLEDMMIMMNHAWKNPALRKIITTLEYPILSLASNPNGLVLNSTLSMYPLGLKFNGGEIIGGKSGFTLEAGCNLISIAKMDHGQTYLLLTAKADGDPLFDQNQMKDARQVYEALANLT